MLQEEEIPLMEEPAVRGEAGPGPGPGAADSLITLSEQLNSLTQGHIID